MSRRPQHRAGPRSEGRQSSARTGEATGVRGIVVVAPLWSTPLQLSPLLITLTSGPPHPTVDTLYLQDAPEPSASPGLPWRGATRLTTRHGAGVRAGWAMSSSAGSSRIGYQLPRGDVQRMPSGGCSGAVSWWLSEDEAQRRAARRRDARRGPRAQIGDCRGSQ